VFNGNLSPTAPAQARACRAIHGNGGSRLTITDCTFKFFAWQHPVGTGNMTKIVINQNRIGQCGGIGSEGGCTDLLISDNYFFEPTSDYGIMAAGNINTNKNVFIFRNNMPFGSHDYGGAHSGGGGIDVVADNAIVAFNFIQDAKPKFGIFVHDNVNKGGSDAVGNITVLGNTIKGGFGFFYEF
jgi:hypothetical protein